MAAERSGSPAVRLFLAYTFRLFKNLSLMVVEWCGVGELCEGPAMDARRSYYPAPGQDDLAEPAPDANRLDCSDIPYITAANDNFRVKDRLSARCGDLLRRLISLRSGSWPN